MVSFSDLRCQNQLIVNRVLNRIGEADAADLAFLKEAPFLMQLPYLKAMEEGAPEGITFYYVWLGSKGKPFAFFYFQVIELDATDVGSIVNLEPYSKTVRNLSSLITSMLFGKKKTKPHYLLVNGNLCITGQVGSFVAPGKMEQASQAIVPLLRKITAELESRGLVIASIVKDFPSHADPFSKVLPKQSWNAFSMDPIMTMRIPTHWNSFEDYLAALSAKYRQRVQAAFKKSKDIELRVLSHDELIKRQKELDVLYKNVQDKSPIRLVHPDIRYLLALSKHLGEACVFKGFFLDGKMIGFMCGIRCGEHFEAHHIGMDYAVAKQYSLYLNILYEYIKMAIDVKAPLLSFGRTAIEMKTTVGAVPEQLNVYLRINNRVLNHLIAPFLPKGPAEEWIPRDPFKNN